MKSNAIIRNIKDPSGILLILFTLVCIASLVYYSSILNQMKQALAYEGAWTYQIENTQISGKGLHELESVKKLTKVEYQTTLQVAEEDNLYIRGTYQCADVYINGTHTAALPYNSVSAPGLWMELIPLPKGTAEISLVVYSPYDHYSGKAVSVQIGDSNTMERFLLLQSFIRLMTAAVIIIAGIFFIYFFFVLKQSSGAGEWLLAFGIFVIVYALYSLVHGAGPDYVIYNLLSPGMTGYVSLFLFYFMIIPNNTMMYFGSRNYRKIYLAMLGLVICFFVGAIVMDFLGLKALPEDITVRQYLVFGYSMLYMVLTLLDYRKGNKAAIWYFLWISLTYAAYVVDAYNLLHVSSPMPGFTVSYLAVYAMVIIVLIHTVKSVMRLLIGQKAELNSMELKNSLAMESYENVKASIEQTQMLNHEMRNARAILRLFLQQNRVDKAQEFLNEMDERNKNKIYSDNYLIDGIIKSRSLKMEENGIRFIGKIEAIDDINISESKLCTFLMNLLDNAIDSCMRASGDKRRFVSLAIKTKPPYLHIECTNTKGVPVARAGGMIISTKRNKSNHGFGLKIMEQIVEQHQGVMTLVEQEDIVTVSAVFRNAKNK